MKLLFCPHCGDVFKLRFHERACECGRVRGRYVDDINAEAHGAGYLLGFANRALAQAIVTHNTQPPRTDGKGHRFEAFVIPAAAPTVKWGH